MTNDEEEDNHSTMTSVIILFLVVVGVIIYLLLWLRGKQSRAVRKVRQEHQARIKTGETLDQIVRKAMTQRKKNSRRQVVKSFIIRSKSQ